MSPYWYKQMIKYSHKWGRKEKSPKQDFYINYVDSPLTKVKKHIPRLCTYGLCTATSFQRIQYGGGEENNFTVQTPNQHHLSQVTKANITSDKSHWCDVMKIGQQIHSPSLIMRKASAKSQPVRYPQNCPGYPNEEILRNCHSQRKTQWSNAKRSPGWNPGSE